MTALFWRDIKLSFGAGNSIIISLLFFLAVTTIVPFAVGPEPEVLRKIGAGMVWVGALLSILLSLERMFQADAQDGSLDLIIMGQDFTALTLIVFSKTIAHWIGTVLPLIIVAPLFALFLNLEPYSILIVIITLILGTPAITFIGAVGAALGVSLPRGGMLISVIVLPLTMPIMIFGVGAANSIFSPTDSLMAPLMFLSAFSLIFCLIGSIAATFTLKYLSE